jgi:RNA polymerase sigma-70 factor (ECF subfamily)
MQADDSALVAQARGGDEEAFRLLVERHSRSVYKLAFRMTGRPQDAEDIVQETFVRAFRQLSRFAAQSSFTTWLYRIGFNCAVDHLRARPRREAQPHRDGADSDRLPCRAPGADDLVFAAEIGSRVDAALATLTAQERAAFLMRHQHGCSIQEICRALDIGADAAKHSVFRAVKKMRRALQPFMPARTSD